MRAVATNPNAERLLLAGCLGLFAAVFVRNVWVVDDAFITFRVVENFVAGLGLTWNPGERVQVFTHPLWMLLLIPVRAVTGELFFSCLAVSLGACLAALALARRGLAAEDAAWRFALLAGLVVSSKSVMDYSSSGLENALTYLLVSAFVLAAARVDAAPTPRGVAALWLLVSLAFVNRHDAVLLCLPGAVWATGRAFAALGPRALSAAALGLAPAALWLAFATLYFGFPLPNTYYAKAAVALPLDERLRRGYAYFGNSLEWDGLAHAAALAAAGLAWARRDRVALGAIAGCALYYGFVLLHASATHMGLRLFSAPFFLAIVVLARLWPDRRTAIAAGAVLLAWNLAWPMAPWKMGSPFYRLPAAVESHIDTRGIVEREGPRVRLGRTGLECLSEHPWFADGLRFRERPERVHVGGPGGGEAMGYFGYAAGPTKHIVDYCALTDPLLSHLPTCLPAPRRGWKSGHFYRMLPEGYLESLVADENRIANPAIRAFYEDLRLAARSRDLFAPARLKAIWRLSTGGRRTLPERAPLPEGLCRSMGERRGPVPGS